VLDLPIALQPVVEFSSRRGSIFDDPGDEKSWRISQRGAGLTHHFAGREPSWYASAIGPLQGIDRVLDLGCGLGLTLQALREQGSTHVLGIDRWFTFIERATQEMPMVAHDLTLPMPFLESGSFDAVFSHYALEYMSPIGIRQTLREARRVLAPGGLLVIYLAAIGLGDGDPARTVPYAPAAMRTLLEEAGFDEIDVEAPDEGRNSVAKARRPRHDLDRGGAGAEQVRASVEGDTQISVAFRGGGDRVVCELAGDARTATLAFDLPPAAGEPRSARVAVCARCLPTATGTELRLWVWRGAVPLVSECFRFELAVSEVTVKCSANIEHYSVWTPGELSLEPLGDACTRAAELPAAAGLSEIERGAEGRKVVVERPGEVRIDAARLMGEGRNRFLVRRAQSVTVPEVDAEWAVGQAHGIVVAAEELGEGGVGELLRWARWRGAPVFVDGESWERIGAAASASLLEPAPPIVLVDPVLGRDRPPRPLPRDVLDLAESTSGPHLLLSAASRALTAEVDLQRWRGGLLHGGPGGRDGSPGMAEANEALRYLTERIMLLQLRYLRPLSWAEVGRRPAPA
jgi:SAM-dependent methyltransferase